MTKHLSKTSSFLILFTLGLITAFFTIPEFALAAGGGGGEHKSLDLTQDIVGYTVIFIFVCAYALVMVEEAIHLRKSKPVILAAGMIWAIIGYVYASHGMSHAAEVAIRHNILEYAELFLFLLVAMTYINVMEESHVFEALRSWLVRKGLSFRQLFWMTGVLAFFISPIADNLTTALLMCAVVMAVGVSSPKFVAIACVNIVVAANAGGAFSPFGDITTLMVWQKGIVAFQEFFVLFFPSVINFVVPAAIMHFFIPNESPAPSDDVVEVKEGGMIVVFLFLCTIATAVSFHNFFGLPPMMGMMTGLAYLQFFGFYLRMFGKEAKSIKQQEESGKPEKLADGTTLHHSSTASIVAGYDVFDSIERAEWDTLLFFFGIVLCVGGLGFLGYLNITSELLYTQMGPTFANIAVGVISAVVDNIPVMFAVLSMQPEMSHGQWLLVTLTAGVGGSLLSIGSAAGVALMGQARGIYTFGSHLKWTPVIALGYAASIYAHMIINEHHF